MPLRDAYRTPPVLSYSSIPSSSRDLIQALRQAELGSRSLVSFDVDGQLPLSLRPGSQYRRRKRPLPRALPRLGSQQVPPPRVMMAQKISPAVTGADESSPELLQNFAKDIAETGLDELYALLRAVPSNGSSALRTGVTHLQPELSSASSPPASIRGKNSHGVNSGGYPKNLQEQQQSSTNEPPWSLESSGSASTAKLDYRLLAQALKKSSSPLRSRMQETHQPLKESAPPQQHPQPSEQPQQSQPPPHDELQQQQDQRETEQQPEPVAESPDANRPAEPAAKLDYEQLAMALRRRPQDAKTQSASLVTGASKKDDSSANSAVAAAQRARLRHGADDDPLGRGLRWVMALEHGIMTEMERLAVEARQGEEERQQALKRAEEVIRSPVMMPTSKAKAKAKAPAKTKAKHGGMKPAETQRQPGQVLAWQQMDAEELVASRARLAAVLLGMYERLLTYRQGRAFEQWCTAIQLLMDEEVLSSALKIQCMVRQQRARKAAARARREREEAAAAKAVYLDEQWQRTHNAALVLQRVARGWLRGRRVAAERRRRHRAARKIQAWRRSRLTDWTNMAKELKRQRALAAIPRAQAVVRGFLDRRRLVHRRLVVRHDRHLARYGNFHDLLMVNFEQEGAATTIQSWWRARDLPRARRPDPVLDYVLFEVARVRTAATTIQALARGVLLRRRWPVLRAQRLAAKRLARRLRAIIRTMMVLQEWLRRQQPSTPQFELEHRELVVRPELPPPKEAKAKAAGPGLLSGWSHLVSGLPLPSPLKKPKPAARKPRLRRPSSEDVTDLLSTARGMDTMTLQGLSDDMPSLAEQVERRRKEAFAAILIQAAARRFLAMKQARRARLSAVLHKNIYVRHACRVAVRSWRRRREEKAMRRIRAAMIMQRYMRRYRARCLLALYRSTGTRLAIWLQARTRGIQTRMCFERMRHAATAKTERALAGKIFFQATAKSAALSMVLRMSSLDDPLVDSELQRIFLHYTATQGRPAAKSPAKQQHADKGLHRVQSKAKQEEDASEGLNMDMNRWCRFMRDFNLHTSKAYDARAVFVETKEESRLSMTYSPAFLSAVQRLADLRHPKTQAHGRFTASEARLLHFLIDHLYRTDVGRQLIASLAPRERYAVRAEEWIASSALLLQRVYRGSRVRRLVMAAMADRRKELEQQRLTRAIIAVQGLWRSHRVRRLVHKLAKDLYERCIDTSTGHVYYYNPRTGRATWTKPQLLGRPSDLRNPIYVPEPDRVYSITCQTCNTRVAQRYCRDCDEYYCRQDHATSHGKGKYAAHDVFPLDVCVQCGTQVANRSCLKCMDSYCDTCYTGMHRTGQMKWHRWKPLTAMCHTCKAFMAHRHCGTCGIDLCRRCATDKGHEQWHVVSAFPYRCSSMVRHDESMVLENQRRAMREAHEQRIKYLAEARRWFRAREIQRVWRGYWARKPYRQLLGGGNRARQRARDRVLRSTLGYKLRFVFGLAPVLASDPPSIKVLKRYPMWMHGLITQAVDGEWAAAYHEGKEQDDFLRKHPIWTRKGLFLEERIEMACLSMQRDWAQAKADGLQRTITGLKKRLVSIKGKEKKEEARKRIRDMKDEASRMDQMLIAVQSQCKRLLKRREEREGPNRLWKRVEDFRLYGRPAPFKLRVKTGERTFRTSGEAARKALARGQRYRLGDRRSGLVFRVEAVTVLKPAKRTAEEEWQWVEGVGWQARPPSEASLVVTMDRDWVAEEEGAAVRAHALPPPVFPYWIANSLSYALSRSTLVQLPLKVFILHLYRRAAHLRALVKNYDEDGSQAAALQSRANYLDAQRVAALRRRFRYVRATDKVEFDQLAALHAFLSEKWELVKARGLEVLTRWVEERRQASDDVYLKWQLSLDRVEVLVLWKEDLEVDKTEPLGKVEVDIDCPVSVMREKLRRELGVELNGKWGHSYGFLDKSGTMVVRAKESSSRLNELVVSGMNDRTRAVERKVVIAADTTRPKEPILILPKKQKKQTEEDKEVEEAEKRLQEAEEEERYKKLLEAGALDGDDSSDEDEG